MIAFLDSETESPLPPYQRDWWVMGVCAVPGVPALFVMCKVTLWSAVVLNPTPEELAAAAEGPQAYKFKLSDESRLFNIHPGVSQKDDENPNGSVPAD